MREGNEAAERKGLAKLILNLRENPKNIHETFNENLDKSSRNL